MCLTRFFVWGFYPAINPALENLAKPATYNILKHSSTLASNMDAFSSAEAKRFRQRHPGWVLSGARLVSSPDLQLLAFAMLMCEVLHVKCFGDRLIRMVFHCAATVGFTCAAAALAVLQVLSVYTL